jgi:hypothetical protein
MEVTTNYEALDTFYMAEEGEEMVSWRRNGQR